MPSPKGKLSSYQNIITAILGIILALAIVVWMGSTLSKVDREKTESKPLEKQAADNQKLTTAQHLEEAKKALAEKSADFPEGKTWDAEIHLKDIPPEAKEYQQAQSLLKEIKKREAKVLAARQAEQEKVKKEETKALQVQRTHYADLLERNFLDKGFDFTVTVSGQDNALLKIKWVLMSRPLVYKMTKDGELLDIWKKMGFKKVIFSDGYRTSWTYDLERGDWTN